MLVATSPLEIGGARDANDEVNDTEQNAEDYLEQRENWRGSSWVPRRHKQFKFELLDFGLVLAGALFSVGALYILKMNVDQADLDKIPFFFFSFSLTCIVPWNLGICLMNILRWADDRTTKILMTVDYTLFTTVLLLGRSHSVYKSSSVAKEVRLDVASSYYVFVVCQVFGLAFAPLILIYT